MPSLRRILFDAKNLARREQYRQAIRLYRKSLDVDPKNEEALIGLGSCYYSLGDSHRARHIWLACLNLFPNSERTKLLLEKTPHQEGEEALDLDVILKESLDDELAGLGIPYYREESLFRRNSKAILLVGGLGFLVMIPFVIRLWLGGGEGTGGGSEGSGGSEEIPVSKADLPVPMTYDGRSINYFGINLEGVLGTDSTGGEPLWRTASQVCGDWGYVRVSIPDPESMANNVLETVVRARAHRLIPVFVVPAPFPRDSAGLNADFVPIIRSYRAAILELNRLGVQIPFLECPDRVDRLRSFTGYADWLEVFANEIKRFSPQTKLIAGGIRSEDPGFLRSVLQYRPDLADLIDLWSVGARPATRILDLGANGSNTDYYAPFSEILKRFGAKKPRLVLTPFSAEKDPVNSRYVPRGEPLVHAWKGSHRFNEWVLANTSFSVSSPLPWSWPGSEWFEPAGNETKTYVRIKNLPKPKGGDYLLFGGQVVEGRVFDQDLGHGIPGAYVAAFPGPYVTTTDSSGKYRIEGLFNSPYRLKVFKDGYLNVSEGKVTPVGSMRTWDAAVSRVGLIEGGFDKQEASTGVAEGWVVSSKDEGALLSLDDKDRRSGAGAQRIDIEAGPKRVLIESLGKPLSAIPGTTYNAEVWVKTRGVIIGRGQGLTCRLDFSDSMGQVMGSVAVMDSSEGETGWHPCAVTAVAPAAASRVQLGIDIFVSKGIYWLDDAFVGAAAAPLPSDVFGEWTKPGSAKVAGTVTDVGGRPVQGAAVSLRPGGKTGVTDEAGRYSVPNLLPGTYSLFVTHPIFRVKRMDGLTLGDRANERKDFALEFVPLPEELRDPGFEKVSTDPRVIDGWNRWGFVDGILEYGGTTPSVQPHRGFGTLALKADPTPRRGGVFQSVRAESGAGYEASCWVHIGAPDNRRDWAKVRIGIDPFGGIDPQSKDVVWGEWQDEPGDWRRAKVLAKAERPRITAFIELVQISIASEILVDTVQVRKGPVLGSR